MTVCTILPLRWPGSRGSYSATWKALAKTVSGTRVVSMVLIIVTGLAAVSIRSSAGARIRHIDDPTTLEAHALAASDARDLVRMDSDKG